MPELKKQVIAVIKYDVDNAIFQLEYKRDFNAAIGCLIRACKYYLAYRNIF